MAVPAHDERDLAFAQAFELPVRRVVKPAGGKGKGKGKGKEGEEAAVKEEEEVVVEAFSGKGVAINSGEVNERSLRPFCTMHRPLFFHFFRTAAVCIAYRYSQIFLMCHPDIQPESDTELAPFPTSNTRDEELNRQQYRAFVHRFPNPDSPTGVDPHPSPHPLPLFLPKIISRTLDFLFTPIRYVSIRKIKNNNGYSIEKRCDRKRLWCRETFVCCKQGLDGLSTEECAEAVVSRLEAKQHGRKEINYRLRDWIFSRQRYWGEVQYIY